MKGIVLRAGSIFLVVCSCLMQGCNSPFQVKEVYTPRLVVYGIVFRGDSTVRIRVQTNSKDPIPDPNNSSMLDSLSGAISDEGMNEVFPLSASYADSMNYLEGTLWTRKKSELLLEVHAPGFVTCSSMLTVLDSAKIYVTDWNTDAELRQPFSESDTSGLKFLVYPSPLTKGIRATLSAVYERTSPSGLKATGEFTINPSYQQDTTSYLLRVNGSPFYVSFFLSDYRDIWNKAMAASNGGTISIVVRITQIDATLYDFYSTVNGFNDRTTMRTERPVYTNIVGGLGFFGSASNDSLVIPVYP